MGAMSSNAPHPRMTETEDRAAYDPARFHAITLAADEARAHHKGLADRRQHLEDQIARLTARLPTKRDPKYGRPISFAAAYPDVHKKVAGLRAEIASIDERITRGAPRRAALAQLASACRTHVNRLEQPATTRTPAVDVGAEPQRMGGESHGA